VSFATHVVAAKAPSGAVVVTVVAATLYRNIYVLYVCVCMYMYNLDVECPSRPV